MTKRRASNKRHTSNKRHARRKRHVSKKRQHDIKFHHALKKLKQLKPSHRSQAMRMANDSFIRKMCSEIRKLRYKKLPSAKSRVLKRHRSTLRKLINNKTTLATKRKILSQQRGGIFPLLPILMAAAGPALGGLAGAVANKIINK